MRNDKDNLIVDLTFKFSLAIVEFCEVLERNKKYVLARQLLKSGRQLVLMSVKHRTLKAKRTLYINSK